MHPGPHLCPLTGQRVAQLWHLATDLATDLARLDDARARYRHGNRLDDATAIRLATGPALPLSPANQSKG
ncbi:hypothetical protein [Nonomuraea basaltis]|uniref:hypothetical protein n=1 Tax=Nonomuraea basaltis TaxID=2495887 RepID=UPI00110C5CFD|nr:hypothetical protein [Nonomuraea basaltis]TMR93314.1 hypothetical protein EJK15_39820 [Nonomuraea basaltis]